jgi:hypothetical protein
MQKRSIHLAIVGLLVGTLFGCSESSIAALQGRWVGEIACSNGPLDISVGFDIDGSKIGGTAFIFQGTRRDFTVKGRQLLCIRYAQCGDDSCSDDNECVLKHDKVPRSPSFGPDECPVALPTVISNNTRCSNGQCTQCTEQQAYERLLLTFSDDDEQRANPSVNVARMGDTRLTGMISDVCGGGRSGELLLTKEQR